MDLPGLHMTPEYGGAGAALIETAIAFTELGRAMTPVLFPTTTFAIEAVLRVGDDQQRRRLLLGLVRGDQIGAFASVGPSLSVEASADPHATAVCADRGGAPACS